MRRNKITSVTLLLFLSFGFWSCEKAIDSVQYESTIYFPQSGDTELSPLWGQSTYDLAVYRAGINQAQKSFEVEVVYDQAGGEAFINDSNNYELKRFGFPILFKNIPEEDRYKLLPEGFYNLPSEKVSIPSDGERGFFSIAFKNVSEAINGAKYILPLKIARTTPEAILLMENSQVILHLADYRNAYGGLYKAEGKVTNPSTSNVINIDARYDSQSIEQNTISIPGPINGIQLNLTINNDEVTVAGAPGSEKYNIKGISGNPSTYSGSFSELYQRNKGDFKLNYTYDIVTSGVTTVYTVEEELNFWL